MNSCSFCDSNNIQKQLIYEDKVMLVIYPSSPIIFQHLMIIPKRHISYFEEMNDEEILESANLVKKIYKIFQKEGASGFNLFTNVGKKAGQHVLHFHWHIFIRFDDEKNSPYKILNNPKLKQNLSFIVWKKQKKYISNLFKI